MKTSTSFVLGVLAGTTVAYVLRRKDFRKAAVMAMSKGMKLKDDATRMIESLKENVSDFIAESTMNAEDEIDEFAEEVVEPPKAAKRRTPAKDNAAKN